MLRLTQVLQGFLAEDERTRHAALLAGLHVLAAPRCHGFSLTHCFKLSPLSPCTPWAVSSLLSSSCFLASSLSLLLLSIHGHMYLSRDHSDIVLRTASTSPNKIYSHTNTYLWLCNFCLYQAPRICIIVIVTQADRTLSFSKTLTEYANHYTH